MHLPNTAFQNVILIVNIFFADQSELASEVFSLKSDLSRLAASFEAGKKSLVKSLETKLVKKKCKWMDIETKGRISNFILKGDENHAQKWTGLCHSGRLAFWNFLGEAKDHLQIWGRECKSGTMRALSVEDQFLMTLMILRKDWDYTEVAAIFDLDYHMVSAVFKTWLQFMYVKLKDREEFFFTKKSEMDKSTLPKCFQTKEFRETRVVIDCTEIFVESSR